MQKKKTLLQKNDILDVIKDLNDTFPRCSLDDIKEYEEWIFNCKLGKKFYKELQSVLCTEECMKYEANTTYTQGTVVVYKGVRKIVLEDTNCIPSTKGKWENAPKFCGDNADCFNSFWCNYLMRYLAWGVMSSKVGAMGSRFEDNGSHTRSYNPSTSVPADKYDMSNKIKYYKNRTLMAWDNMCAYAEGKECLSNFCKFETAACPKPRIRTRSRRWH